MSRYELHGGLARTLLLLILLATLQGPSVFAQPRLSSADDNVPATTTGRTLVLLVNFPGDIPPAGVTAAGVRDLVFGEHSSLRHFYAENSYNHLVLSGDVRGWLEVPIAPGCNLDDVTKQALNAVRRHDPSIRFTDYNHIITVATFSSSRCPDGQSTLGAKPFATPDGILTASRALIRSTSVNFYTLAHEFGHGLGVHHAGLRACEHEPLGGDCPIWEYGDHFSVMGGAYDVAGGHFTIAQKERMGWVDDEDVPLVTRSGEYAICPIEVDDACPKGIKIPRADGSALYIEYRQPIGFDATLNDPTVFQGALLHIFDPADPRKTQLIDPIPPGYVRLNALHVGQTLVDPGTGTRVSTVAAENGRLNIQVQRVRGVERVPIHDEVPG